MNNTYIFLLIIITLFIIIHLCRRFEHFPSIGHKIHGDASYMKCVIKNDRDCHGSNKGATGFVYYN